MKISKINKTIALMKSNKYGFDMSVYFRQGSPRCIAGYALYANGISEMKAIQDYGSFSRAAGEILGIRIVERVNLFRRNSATREDAINVLEYLKDTGKVDWVESEGYLEKKNG